MNMDTEDNVGGPAMSSGRYLTDVELFLRMKLVADVAKTPGYIRENMDVFHRAVKHGYPQVTKKSYDGKDDGSLVRLFMDSLAYGITDDHVKFFPALKDLQDMVADSELRANEWADERFKKAKYLYRGTSIEEVISIVKNLWQDSKEGTYGSGDYRSVSLNPYVARGYAPAGEVKIVIQVPKELVGDGVTASKYRSSVTDQSTGSDFFKGESRQRQLSRIGLEEYFLMKRANLSKIKDKLIINFMVRSEHVDGHEKDLESFEIFKKEYGNEFAEFRMINEEDDVKEWSDIWNE